MRDEPIDKSRALVELRRICVDTLRIDDPDYAVMMSAIEALSSVKPQWLAPDGTVPIPRGARFVAPQSSVAPHLCPENMQPCDMGCTGGWCVTLHGGSPANYAAPGQGRDASALPGRPVAQDAHAPVSAPHPEVARSETPVTDDALDRLQLSQSFIDQTRLFDRHYVLPLIEHARQMERDANNALNALEQERDIRSTREITLSLVADGLGVEHEPHQTFDERLLEASCAPRSTHAPSASTRITEGTEFDVDVTDGVGRKDSLRVVLASEYRRVLDLHRALMTEADRRYDEAFSSVARSEGGKA